MERFATDAVFLVSKGFFKHLLTNQPVQQHLLLPELVIRELLQHINDLAGACTETLKLQI